jgi:ATP-dependent helicase/nuclease subunit B
VALAVERNRLLQELATFCAAHPVDEKILLVPSFPVGQQILDALALSGCAHLNLRPATVFSLAHEIAGPSLAAEGRRLLSRAQLLSVVESACDEVLTEDSYFGKLRARVGLHRALQRTLDELRRAGLGAAPLPMSAFEEPRKGRELAALARAYAKALVAMGAADSADVLHRAVSLCAAGSSLPESALLLRPSGLDPAPLEETFLAAFARQIVTLAEDSPEHGPPGVDVAFAQALGEENEVRAIFRRLAAGTFAADSVEIVFEDDATYRPLVYELASQYGVPCTFAEGVPVAYTLPGQGILDLLDWVATDFASAPIERLLAEGRVDLGAFTPKGTRPSGLRAARLLRRARIFSGASRWAPRLDALAARENAPLEGEDADGPAERARLERHATAVALRDFTARLFALVPPPSRGRISLPALARACHTLTTTLLRRRGPLDAAAVQALAGLFSELGDLPDRALPPREAADRLKEAVRGLAVDSSTPFPGRIHVSRLGRGGYAARSRTFVLGLDEARFPGSGRQDPVLLDSERKALNDALPAAHLTIRGVAGPDDSRRALRAVLARSRGHVVLSFSNRDFLQDAERFPSPVLLDLFRERESRADASWSDFTTALPPSETFVPPGEPLDGSEWWLTRVRETPGAPGLAREVDAAYSWLAAGTHAEEERSSRLFTAWDGAVRADAAALDPRLTNEPLSASRLEKLGRCPRAYFFEYVLGLTPPEEPRAVDVWLNAREFGNLLHETLYDFMSGLRAEGSRLEPVRDAARLKAAAGRRLARWREIVPPPTLAAYRAQEDELLAACEIFLKSEAENPGASPLYFEVPFGMSRGSASEPLASREPVEIRTRRGSFRLQGQIDRIDETGPGRYAVWDYKSGGDWAFKEEDRREHPLRGGRLLQHALYRRAAAILLARAGTAVEEVVSGYFLPTRKGRMQRFELEVRDEDVDGTLDDLFDLVASGAFPHTADAGDCRFCPYTSICGNVAAAAARAETKRTAADADTRLEPLRRILRRDV